MFLEISLSSSGSLTRSTIWVEAGRFLGGLPFRRDCKAMGESAMVKTNKHYILSTFYMVSFDVICIQIMVMNE